MEKDFFFFLSLVVSWISGQFTTGKRYLAVEELKHHMPQFIQRDEKKCMLHPVSTI